jgi:hypothetical protein
MSTSESSSTLQLSTVTTPADRVGDALSGFATFLAFWVGALLPLTYVPLLLGGVLTTRPLAFGLLVVVNVAAMVLGHGYKRPA